MKSLQEIVDPHGICFGCGTAHAEGLHIRSYPDEDGVHVIATMTPSERYCGWPGLAYGGYLAMLSDCHSNWTAIYAHYKAENRSLTSDPQIMCVTGSLSVAYRKPTPLGVPLHLRSRVEGEVGRKTRVLTEISANGIVTVSADVVLVRVNVDDLAKQAHAAIAAVSGASS